VRRSAFGAALAAVAVAGFALAGCGGEKQSTSTTSPPATTETTTETSTTVTTTPVPTIALRVYFLQQGKVATARRTVPKTSAVAGAALTELAAGPNDAERSVGLTTAVPGGATFEDLHVEDGVASVIPSERLSRAAQAQVVYTLTQFPTVRAVEFGGGRLTRSDFEAETPQILIESPTPFETISSPLRIRGTANTFEATFIVELNLHAAGQLAFHRFVTATSGSGTRGTFDVTTRFSVHGFGPVSLIAYEESAEDGRPLHRVEIPLNLSG
jgi:immunoglobulin-like protein involved in spore germination/sporulation and spore germination protein